MGEDEIALFPLQAPLFPDGVLRLRIFEPRYLDMVRRCQRDDRPFGVVRLIEGAEVRRRDGEGFAPERFESIGSLARIERLEPLGAGLLGLRCRGGRRFRLTSRHCTPHGLWIGRAEWLDDDVLLPPPEDLRPAQRLLQTLLHTLEQGAAADDLPLQPPYRWEDCGWLANRWCELLPLPAQQRQRLLELDNPLLRLELVADEIERLHGRDAG